MQQIVTLFNSSLVKDVYDVKVKENEIIFYQLETSGIISVVSSLKVLSDFSFCVNNLSLAESAKRYAYLCKKGKISLFSQVENILLHIKQRSVYDQDENLHKITALINTMIENDGDIDKQTRIKFWLDQFLGIFASKHKFSRQVIVFSYQLLSRSTKTYEYMLRSQYFCLPSIRYLRLITSSINKSTSMLDAEGAVQYFKCICETLQDKEKIVALLIDEIYLSNRVEFSNGVIYGLDEEGEINKTSLTFMIKSLLSTYKDVVSIQPIHTLTSAYLCQSIISVIKMLHFSGFVVCCTIVDNSAPNAKCYKEMGLESTPSGRHYFEHPCTKQPVFFLFDSVHLLKKIYTNWLNKTVLHYPQFLEQGTEESTVFISNADFQIVKNIFFKECGSSARIAHKLSTKCLNPTSLERTSVMLPYAVFHESTIAAFKFYGLHNGTQNFLQLILDWWTILNVKSPFKGIRLKLESAKPIFPGDIRMLTLKQYAQFFYRWQLYRQSDTGANNKICISQQTLAALITTCSAVVELMQFIFDKHQFQYLLTGKLQNDSIERRFGLYRQMHGGNYLISLRQLLNSEKLIKVSHLLLKSSLSIKELSNYGIETENVTDADCENFLSADFFQDTLTSIPIFDPSTISADDMNLVTYITGWACNSLISKVNCESCKKWIVVGDVLEILTDENLNVEFYSLTFQRDRGALKWPAQYPLYLASKTFYFFNKLRKQNKLAKILNQKSMNITSVQCLEALFNQYESTHQHILPVVSSHCDENHALTFIRKCVITKTFSIFLRNFAHESSSDRSTGRNSRKLSKLKP